MANAIFDVKTSTPYDPDQITAFVQLSPVGSYYGNPIARALTERNNKGVFAIYLNGSDEFTSTGIDRRMSDVAEKLNKIYQPIMQWETCCSTMMTWPTDYGHPERK